MSTRFTTSRCLLRPNTPRVSLADGNGFGAVALAGLLAREGVSMDPPQKAVNSASAKEPHFPAKAKS